MHLEGFGNSVYQLMGKFSLILYILKNYYDFHGMYMMNVLSHNLLYVQPQI